MSGVPATELFDLISHAIDRDGPADPQEEQRFKALMAKSPPDVGFNDVSLDMGPGKLTGSFSMPMSLDGRFSAHAAIRLVGYDALLTDTNSHSEMKQVGPTLIFIKALAGPMDRRWCGTSAIRARSFW